MSSEIDHINQAAHNKKVSDHLLLNQHYYDWALVTIFYSVIHILEAVIIFEEGGNTQQMKSSNETAYHFVSEYVKNKYGKDTWRTFEAYKNASMEIRYLRSYNNVNCIPSHSFYSKSDVDNFVNKRFDKFFNDLKSSTRLNLNFP